MDGWTSRSNISTSIKINVHFKMMIHVIKSSESYVLVKVEIKFIIHFKINIYSYLCRDVRSITINDAGEANISYPVSIYDVQVHDRSCGAVTNSMVYGVTGGPRFHR